MTLKELLEIREHRFDVNEIITSSDVYHAYREGWTDAVKDIRIVLEAHGFDLEIQLD